MIAAFLQKYAKSYKDSTLSVTHGYCEDDAETETKWIDVNVIGTPATDGIDVQMWFSEHFEQDTFKSDVAEAVFKTYYKDTAAF